MRELQTIEVKVKFKVDTELDVSKLTEEDLEMLKSKILESINSNELIFVFFKKEGELE